MRLLLVFLVIISMTVGQFDNTRGPVTCEGGILAIETRDSYCCFENGLKYCCKKIDPLICFTDKMENDITITRPNIGPVSLMGPTPFTQTALGRDESMGPSQITPMEVRPMPPAGAMGVDPMQPMGPIQTNGVMGQDRRQPMGQMGPLQPTGPTGSGFTTPIDQDPMDPFQNGPEDIAARKEDEPCTAVKVHRSGLSTLRVTEGKVLRLVTLVFSQAEGCDSETELSIRWGNLEPGRDYQILFGDNIACGAKIDDAIEVARMEVTARNGNVQVPSVVPHLRDVKGKQVSLRVIPSGETYACGTLTVFGL